MWVNDRQALKKSNDNPYLVFAKKLKANTAEEENMKLLKSALLTILTLLILISAFPTVAMAQDDGFEARLTAPSKSSSYYNKSLNVFSQTGYGMPNCTAYAFGRIYEITGEKPLITRGNAGSWWQINKSNGYYSYGQEPQEGAIACWSNHVAVVEKIDGNTVTCSQSHWRGTYFDTCTFTSGASHFGQKFYGYIYACEDYLNSLEEEAEETQGAYKKEKPQYKEVNTNQTTFGKIDLTSQEDEEILINSVVLKNAIA